MATSAVRDACSSASSMKCFKRSNVKTSPTATPSFAKAKLLKVFLTRVRMLEERLAASLGDIRGVRAGESSTTRKFDSLETPFHWENVFGCGQERV